MNKDIIIKELYIVYGDMFTEYEATVSDNASYSDSIQIPVGYIHKSDYTQLIDIIKSSLTSLGYSIDDGCYYKVHTSIGFYTGNNYKDKVYNMTPVKVFPCDLYGNIDPNCNPKVELMINDIFNGNRLMTIGSRDVKPHIYDDLNEYMEILYSAHFVPDTCKVNLVNVQPGNENNSVQYQFNHGELICPATICPQPIFIKENK